MLLTVRLQDRLRPTSKKLHTPYYVIANNLDRRTVEWLAKFLVQFRLSIAVFEKLFIVLPQIAHFKYASHSSSFKII